MDRIKSHQLPTCFLTLKPPVLSSRNITVDTINDGLMSRIKSPEITFVATDSSSGDLDNNGPYIKVLKLRVGCTVLLLCNGTMATLEGAKITVFNGMSGEVVGIGDDAGGVIYVKLTKKAVVVKVYRRVLSLTLDNEMVASRTQFPLRLGFAMTIHKSMGMSLEEGTCDLTSVFGDHMAYVALSRFKSLECVDIYSTKSPFALSRMFAANRACLDFHDPLL